MGEVSVVDLFCGAGGLTCGLEAAGLGVAEGVDADERCRHPYDANTSARFVRRDVLEYEAGDIRKAWSGAEHKILVGCAPCQSFSTYSQRGSDVKKGRWALIRRFASLVEETRPDVVSMENVPPLLRTRDYQLLKRRLREAGYHVDDWVVDCRRFGAPQMRRRLVMLASRLGPVEIIPETHAEPTSWNDVESAIGHLPALAAGGVDSDDPMHRASRLSDLNLKRIRVSKPGGTWREWPWSLRSPCHRRRTGKTYPGVYGRMEWQKPAPTITGQCFGFGNGRFGHPEQDRALSLREAAMLQTFPEDFEFFPAHEPFPGMRAVGSLIGNAVPPILGRAIGESIVRHIKSVSKVSTECRLETKSTKEEAPGAMVKDSVSPT